MGHGIRAIPRPSKPASLLAGGADPRTVLLDRVEALLDQADDLLARSRGRTKLDRTRRESAASTRELAAALLGSATGPLHTTTARSDHLAQRLYRRSS
jgi:hypothetical protein